MRASTEAAGCLKSRSNKYPPQPKVGGGAWAPRVEANQMPGMTTTREILCS